MIFIFLLTQGCQVNQYPVYNPMSVNGNDEKHDGYGTGNWQSKSGCSREAYRQAATQWEDDCAGCLAIAAAGY
jgi:hypothetical protein